MKISLSSTFLVLAFLLGSTSINAQSFETSNGSQVKQSLMDFPASADFVNAVSAEYQAVAASVPADETAEVDKSIKLYFLKSLSINTEKTNGNIIQAFSNSLVSTKQFSAKYSATVDTADETYDYYYNLFSN